MLRKLLKHEYIATSRVMLPIYVAVLVLALAMRLTGGVWNAGGFSYSGMGRIGAVVTVLVIMGFFVGIVAVFVASFVQTIGRFRSNLLGDEGYVMFTLPVSTHQLVWAKLIVSVTWFVGAVLLSILAFTIVAADASTFASGFHAFFLEFDDEIAPLSRGHMAAFAIECVLALLLGCANVCLAFYAPLAIGHSFAKRKMLLSVVFFFVIQIVTDVLFNVLGFAASGIDRPALFAGLSGPAAMHALMWVLILGLVLYGAVLYCLTIRMLHRHLDLE